MFDGSETAFNGISWIKRDDRGRTPGLGWVSRDFDNVPMRRQ